MKETSGQRVCVLPLYLLLSCGVMQEVNSLQGGLSRFVMNPMRVAGGFARSVSKSRIREKFSDEDRSEKIKHIEKSKLGRGFLAKSRSPSTTAELTKLKKENQRLQDALRKSEQENRRLVQELDHRIILETFEGEFLNDDELEKISFSLSTNGETDATDSCSPDDDFCPTEPTVPFKVAFRDRAYWLVGLLAMQSCSGFILAHNEALLANHPVSKLNVLLADPQGTLHTINFSSLF